MKNVSDIATLATGVFVLPEAVTRLKACMDDSAASMEDIGEIIAFDPALTGQLLKVANSALYKFPNRIDTITKALQVIGTRAAYDLALAYGISHAFRNVEAKIIDLDHFWEQSVSCGLLAKYLAEQKKHRESERLFVAGLLHNIGELVVVSMFPKEAQRCMAFNARVKPAELQQAICGFTYTELSALIIEGWGIPAPIYQPIDKIHDIETPASDLDVQILQLSYVLALDNVNTDVYPSYNNLVPHLHESLDLAHEDLEDALDITNLQCLSVMSLFNPNAFMLY
ncbi:HDOD domain-containing protein [Alteromonas lipolytica]|uniref:Histidine kinase n=1 Tax=Alteromonas lipolytica TaxID=1856405 RepID=A0A1E8FII3_9ALTE|nr:HDOD domain-containing protein [Alteromonas lipolytica]OFI35760.1 histidine kinase [Alteromonas lipolytica]GGF80527.1 hypothetical protein GCM10011338_36000 [Alteromonas lipolytica]